MSVKIVTKITRCYDCPNATNNAQMHDDPFTSGPANIYWYCRKMKYKDIDNERGPIPSWCPYNS